MQTKLFEVRDRSTFIPVVGVLMYPDGMQRTEQCLKETWLMRMAGYDFVSDPYVLLTRVCGRTLAHYDPFAWGDRTLQTAHIYITNHWHELLSGDVVDVEYILGEMSGPRVSEMPPNWYPRLTGEGAEALEKAQKTPKTGV